MAKSPLNQKEKGRELKATSVLALDAMGSSSRHTKEKKKIASEAEHYVYEEKGGKKSRGSG